MNNIEQGNFVDLKNESYYFISSLQDEHEPIRIIEKSPILENKCIGKIVRGDTNSNILTFEIDRFYDGADLSTKSIHFLVKVGNTVSVESASNIQYNNNRIRFSWVMSYFATSDKSVTVAIEFYGIVDGHDYSLKTTPFTIVVENSLVVTNKEIESINTPENYLVNLSIRVTDLEEKLDGLSENSSSNKQTHVHNNKSILDKIGESNKGTFLFSGKEITKGADGKSAYDIAVNHGFTGSETEWLDSLNCYNSYEILDSKEKIENNTESGRLVDALIVKEVFQSVSNGKQLIASAITDKGVQTDDKDDFKTLAQNIEKIETACNGNTGNKPISSPYLFSINWRNFTLSSCSSDIFIPFAITKPTRFIIKKLYFIGRKLSTANTIACSFRIYGIKKENTNQTIIKNYVLRLASDSTSYITVANIVDEEIDLSEWDEITGIQFFQWAYNGTVIHGVATIQFDAEFHF